MREVRRREALSGLGGLLVTGAAAGIGGIGVTGCDTGRARAAQARAAQVHATPGTLLWRFRTGAGGEQLSLAAADGMVYANGAAPPVHTDVTFGIDATTGQEVWRTHRSALAFTYAAGAGAVYGYESSNSLTYTVAALSADTGRTLWTYDLGDMNVLTGYPLTYTDGLLYSENTQPGLLALDARTGLRVWSRALTAGWTVPGNGAVYASNNTAAGQLVALDAATGSSLWQTGTGLLLDLLTTVDDIVCGLANGRVYAFSTATGTRLWQHELGRTGQLVTVAATTGGTVFFVMALAAGPFTIWALDARTGARAWTRTQARGQRLQALDADADTLYLGLDDGTLFALTAATGKTRWSQRLGGPIRRITAAADAVYATDADGVIAAIKT